MIADEDIRCVPSAILETKNLTLTSKSRFADFQDDTTSENYVQVTELDRYLIYRLPQLKKGGKVKTRVI